jgi:hypothetical protein
MFRLGWLMLASKCSAAALSDVSTLSGVSVVDARAAGVVVGRWATAGLAAWESRWCPVCKTKVETQCRELGDQDGGCCFLLVGPCPHVSVDGEHEFSAALGVLK